MSEVCKQMKHQRRARSLHAPDDTDTGEIFTGSNELFADLYVVAIADEVAAVPLLQNIWLLTALVRFNVLVWHAKCRASGSKRTDVS